MKHSNEAIIEFIEAIIESELTSYQKELIGTFNGMGDDGIIVSPRGNTRRRASDLYLLYKLAVSVMEGVEVK